MHWQDQPDHRPIGRIPSQTGALLPCLHACTHTHVSNDERGSLKQNKKKPPIIPPTKETNNTKQRHCSYPPPQWKGKQGVGTNESCEWSGQRSTQHPRRCTAAAIRVGELAGREVGHRGRGNTALQEIISGQNNNKYHQGSCVTHQSSQALLPHPSPCCCLRGAGLVFGWGRACGCRVLTQFRRV